MKVTIAELNKIKQLRTLRKPISEISKLTGNSRKRIIYLTNYYQLPNNKWTEEERQFLLDNYQQYSKLELAELLNRSIYSILSQKYYLKRKKEKGKRKKEYVTIK